MLIENPLRRRRSPLLVAASLLLALGLAACGGGDDESAEGDGTTTTAPTGDEGSDTATGDTDTDTGETDGGTADADTDAEEAGTSSGDGSAGGGAEATDDGDTPTTGITVEVTEDPVSTDLLDRFAEALPGTGDTQFPITPEDGRCAAEGLDGRLDETDYGALTARIEANESIEPEDGLGPEEIGIIANVFAVCLDFTPLIPVVTGDLGPESGPLVTCLNAEVGEQGVEEAVLFEILADGLADVGGRFYTIGLDSCPDEAITAIGATAAEWVGVTYDAELAACLDAVAVADYQAFLTAGGPFGPGVAEDFLADNCDV
ncbi:MAG: hypothetical protein AAF962_02440 [Actinomycetota bacterium]